MRVRHYTVHTLCLKPEKAKAPLMSEPGDESKDIFSLPKNQELKYKKKVNDCESTIPLFCPELMTISPGLVRPCDFPRPLSPPNEPEKQKWQSFCALASVNLASCIYSQLCKAGRIAESLLIRSLIRWWKTCQIIFTGLQGNRRPCLRPIKSNIFFLCDSTFSWSKDRGYLSPKIIWLYAQDVNYVSASK